MVVSDPAFKRSLQTRPDLFITSHLTKHVKKCKEPVDGKDLMIVNVGPRNNYCVVTSASNAGWSLVLVQVETDRVWSWGGRLDT